MHFCSFRSYLKENWAFFLDENLYSLSFNHGTPTASPTTLSDSSTMIPTMTTIPTSTAMPVDTLEPTVTALPTVSPAPTSEPTVTARPTVTAAPATPSTPTVPTTPTTSPAPTVSPQPTTTRAPTLRPTRTQIPTLAPSSEPTPTLFLEPVVFTCNEIGQVALATRPYQQVTAIPFDVTYLVETLSFFDRFQADLEARILADAVQGALTCGPGIFADDVPPTIPMNTTLTGESCTPEISLCSVLKTNFTIAVQELVSPEATAFLGYVRLSNEMPDYTDALPALDRVEYLRPLLFPPLLGGNETQPPVGLTGSRGGDNVSVSPYTIGAVLAVCIGGVTALGVWARNRQRRNEQHMQLLEDMSVGGEEQGEAA